jgi:hypothetical protein
MLLLTVTFIALNFRPRDRRRFEAMVVALDTEWKVPKGQKEHNLKRVRRDDVGGKALLVSLPSNFLLE